MTYFPKTSNMVIVLGDANDHRNIPIPQIKRLRHLFQNPNKKDIPFYQLIFASNCFGWNITIIGSLDYENEWYTKTLGDSKIKAPSKWITSSRAVEDNSKRIFLFKIKPYEKGNYEKDNKLTIRLSSHKFQPKGLEIIKFRQSTAKPERCAAKMKKWINYFVNQQISH